MCSACVVARMITLYSERDHVAAGFRSLAWAERSRQPDADLVTLRQRRHRLREQVRPQAPARSADPWEICVDALHELRRVHSDPDARESVAEALRRLAWGPDD
jgi:hypothetical protein